MAAAITTCPFSNELLLEIASHLAFLDLIREATLMTSVPLKDRHDAILNACLASKLFYSIFHPLLRKVIFDDGSMHRRRILIKRCLERPSEARQITMLSTIPKSMPSDNVLIGLEEWTPYFEHITRYKLPHTIRALGLFITLLPNLQALQIGVQGHLNVDYRGLLGLFKLAHEDQRLLSKLETITICYTNATQHGFDPTDIEDFIKLPRLVELNARAFFTDRTNLLRAGPWRFEPEQKISNIKVLRLFDCDVNSVFLGKLVRSMKHLEEFMLQWEGKCEAEEDLYIEHIVNILGAHTSSLQRIILDGSLAEHFREPFYHYILPVGSFKEFQRLEILDLPAILLVGKQRHTKWMNDLHEVAEFEKALTAWTTKAEAGGVSKIGDSSSPKPNWDLLTDVLPVSLQVLRLQSPHEITDAQRAAEWLLHFAMTKIEKLERLRVVDLSGWSHEYIDAVMDFCDHDMLQALFMGSNKTLKLPLGYIRSEVSNVDELFE